MEEGFIGKWKRIPGSGRAEDVCWDRQGHRRVVCTSYTILNNTQATSIQCPEEKYIQYTVHSSLYSHKIPLKLNFFDAPAIPVPDYYSNPLIQVAHVAYCEHWKTDSLSFHMAHMCNCERVETPLTDAVHWGVV